MLPSCLLYTGLLCQSSAFFSRPRTANGAIGMYEQRARDLFRELRGHSVGGWKIEDLIDHGKSAVVFRARKPERTVALKIFDPELVARYGELTQLTRIHRELSLRGHRHPHLVEIYDGGKCPSTNHLFLVMQNLTGQPLSQLFPTLPRACIPDLLRQVACAAKFLEDIRLAHRDIKPDNIVINADTGTATLLDLGVLRPISSQSSATDTGDAHPFVGTLQYSPPEFLLREEEDTIEGWRAVTFYQLGAVLHDLIERRRIFSCQRDPYARLVNAVQDAAPTFRATDLPDLVNLAQNCLVKSPDTRLQLVTWDDFLKPRPATSPGLLARQRIAQARQRTSPPQNAKQAWQIRWDTAKRFKELAHSIEIWLRQWCVDQELLPPVEISTSVGQTAKATKFELHLRPDSSYELRHHLLVHIEIRVLDVTINAVEVLAGAMLATSEPPSLDHQPISVYRGVATESALHPVFENVIYPTFELATRDSAESGRININPLLMPGEPQ